MEPRSLLSGFTPTPVEEYYLQLLNDARFNPSAYGVSLGLDLSNVAPSQPLAMNPMLVESSRLHSQDMIAQNYFAHITPQGVDPGARMSAAGFPVNGWAESIESNTQPSAYGGGFPANFSTFDAAFSLKDLIIDQGVPDLGHRIMLLDIGGNDHAMRQVGIGIASQDSNAGNGFTYRLTDTTIDMAGMTNTSPFLTGVAFNDAAGNGEYQPGEGLGGVTISIPGVGSTTTDSAGGYEMQLSPGTYTVIASGGGLAAPVARTVVVGNDNVQMNVVTNPNGDTLSATPEGFVGGTLGSFNAISPGDTAASYSARIDWGNGQFTFATLTPGANNTFDVSGATGYATPGVYDVRVLVTHYSDGKTIAINATVDVSETASSIAASQAGSHSSANASGTVTTGVHGHRHRHHRHSRHHRALHAGRLRLLHAAGRRPLHRRAFQHHANPFHRIHHPHQRHVAFAFLVATDRLVVSPSR